MSTLSHFATQLKAPAKAPRVSAQTLRDEARLLTLAGVMLIGAGFPLTMVLVLFALSPDGLPPLLPIIVGGPPLMLGYIACHYASARLTRAKALETH